MPGGKKRVMLVRCDTLVTPFQRVEGRVLYIADGKIAKIFPPGSAVPDGITQILHEPGAIVAPGFIDLHVHGARGRDLMDGTLESLQAVSSALARHGTTSFLATTMSAPFADIKNALLGFAGHRTSVRD